MTSQHSSGSGDGVPRALATFGAGCFWGVEAAFLQLEGVLDAVSGYEGGVLENPTYQEVCSDRTGHAEVVEVAFDPSRIAYGALLDAFFRMHDPTQLNRHEPDFGSQYRSVVFYHDDAQRDAARAAIERLEASGTYPGKIVTAVEPAATFYRAEDYHQRYFEKHGIACHIAL